MDICIFSSAKGGAAASFKLYMRGIKWDNFLLLNAGYRLVLDAHLSRIGFYIIISCQIRKLFVCVLSLIPLLVLLYATCIVTFFLLIFKILPEWYLELFSVIVSLLFVD